MAGELATPEFLQQEDFQKQLKQRLKEIENYYNDKIGMEDDPLTRQSLELEKDYHRKRQYAEDRDEPTFSSGKGFGLEDFLFAHDNPFFDAIKSTKKEHMIEPGYQGYDMDSSPEEIKYARKYNKELQNMSRFDAPLTATSRGLGAFAGAMMGGLPGLLVGKGLASGIPIVADMIKSSLAKGKADDDALERRFNPHRI
jgi:hypothetical protein